MSCVRYLVDFFLFLKDNAFSFSSAANIVLLFLVFSGAAPSIVLHLSKKKNKKIGSDSRLLHSAVYL